jgi:hypothetical protein
MLSPDFEWDIYLSPQDKVRDTIEVWRTRPDILLEGITSRAESTIPSIEIRDQPEEYIRLETMDHAFKTRMLSLAVRFIRMF